MNNIFKLIGAFGRFQKLVLIIIGLLTSLASMTIYATIFIAAEPKLFCFSINNKTDDNTIYDNVCNIWSNLTTTTATRTINQTYHCEYDKTYYGKTIITEWNLICDRKYLASLTQTIYMFGALFSLFTGYFGDKYGRKRCCLIFVILLALTLTISHLVQLKLFNLSITTKYVVYCISQFLIGFLVNSIYGISFVLIIEFTVDKYHVLFSNLNVYFYVFGELIVLVASYFSRDWQILNWMLVAQSMLLIIPLLFIPESPRWLISQNRFDEATKVCFKIAKINGIKISQEDLETDIKTNELYNELADPMLNDTTIEESKRQKMSEDNENNIWKEIFYPKRHLFKTILLSYIWIANYLLYFGISLGVTTVSNMNPYLIYLCSSIAEILGYSLCFLNDIFGRRKTNIIFLLVTGIVTSIIGIYPQNSSYSEPFKQTLNNVVILLLTCIGKCMIAAAFNTCYVYSSELYPTFARSSVILFMASMGRFGSLLSPQINYLSMMIWKPLSHIVFSCVAVLASFCIFLLPESIIQ